MDGKVGLDGSAAAVRLKGVGVVIATVFFQHATGLAVENAVRGFW